MSKDRVFAAVWRIGAGDKIEVYGVAVAKRTAKRVQLVARHPGLGHCKVIGPDEGYPTASAAVQSLVDKQVDSVARAKLDLKRAEDRLARLRKLLEGPLGRTRSCAPRSLTIRSRSRATRWRTSDLHFRVEGGPEAPEAKRSRALA